MTAKKHTLSSARPRHLQYGGAPPPPGGGGGLGQLCLRNRSTPAPQPDRPPNQEIVYPTEDNLITTDMVTDDGSNVGTENPSDGTW